MMVGEGAGDPHRARWGLNGNAFAAGVDGERCLVEMFEKNDPGHRCRG